MTGDKAGKDYWSNLWEKETLPLSINPLGKGLNNFVSQNFSEYFKGCFKGMNTESASLLEIGCARSVWLPYFAREFGFHVSGLDYSETGCKLTRLILKRNNVEGKIYHCDLFNPPHEVLESFDVVISFGVVEHFDDTKACIKACSRFLVPSGIMITSIPNMVGLNGRIQKLCDRTVYDIHYPIDRETLKCAHTSAGLEVISCDYFLLANFGVINLEGLQGKPYYKILIRLRSWTSKFFWLIGRIVHLPSPNRWTSPYINCMVMKPCD